MTRNSVSCQFCNFSGHETKECRKLAKFLRDHQVVIGSSIPSNNVSPTANVTTSRRTSSSWMFDSGASHHVTSDSASLPNLSEYGGPDEIVLGNGKPLSITHTGHTQLHTPSGPISLKDVLCVPTFQQQIISVAKLCKTNRVSVEFFPTHFFVKDLRTGARLMRGENYLDVYYASLPSMPQLNSITAVSSLDWHHKLGHPSLHVFKLLAKCLGLKFNLQKFHCNSCSINKSHKVPFGMNSFTTTKPLQLVYSDVWGPVERSIDGFTYYIIFVDYHTKYIWLYPMKYKSDVSTLFPQFKLLVEKYFQNPFISLFTDNGGEYVGLTPYLQSQGISHFTTPPHTPEQNGVAERRHRHIVETGLALLHFDNLPLSFWTHAFQTAVYLINRLPTPLLDSQSPYQLLYRKSPTYSKLKPFGCLCYPWLRPYAKSKLHPRSQKCIFLGYSTSRSAYKCYDPISHRLYHSRHVEFVETIFPHKTSTASSPIIPTADTFLSPSTTPTSISFSSPSPHPQNPLPNSPPSSPPPETAPTSHTYHRNPLHRNTNFFDQITSPTVSPLPTNTLDSAAPQSPFFTYRRHHEGPPPTNFFDCQTASRTDRTTAPNATVPITEILQTAPAQTSHPPVPDPHPQPSTSTHPMLTRSKTGCLKQSTPLLTFPLFTRFPQLLNLLPTNKL